MSFSVQSVAQEEGFSGSAGLFVVNDENVQKNSFGSEDTLVSFSPSAQYTNQFGKHRLSLNYDGSYVKFDKLETFDYNDHNIGLSVNFDHSQRLNSSFTAGYSSSRNTFTEAGRQATNFEEFDEITRANFGTRIEIGSQDSIGQIQLALNGTDTKFDGDINRFRNSESLSGSITYSHRLAPNTRALFQISRSQSDFDQDVGIISQSNTQTSYLVGFSWRYSEQVFTNFRIGYFEREFEQSSAGTLDGLALNIDLNWAPTQNTTIMLAAGRNANPSSVAELPSMITTNASTTITYSPTEKLQIYTGYEHRELDFAVSEDETQQIEFGANYAIGTKAILNIAVTSIDRNSNFENLSYEATTKQIGLSIEF